VCVDSGGAAVLLGEALSFPVSSDFDPLFLPDTDATLSAGESIGRRLQAGDVIALSGGLGAGKTHFTMGLVRGLGSEDDVTSPTFTLVHEYRSGCLPVFHFDFYRMETENEVTGIGWDEYLDAGGVCVVEWADRFPALLPSGTEWWSLQVEGTGRKLKRTR
jgi:tRNA threonylcarbamoyladenosine biosynthesis protein TsaE